MQKCWKTLNFDPLYPVWRYYATAMLWCRIVSLKEKNSQALTVAEQNLLMSVQSTAFAVPEPITLQLRAIGNIVTSTKQHLNPVFPPLPVEVIQQQGGFYGALAAPAANIDNSRHNLYEEIPCLGVYAYGVRQSLSNLAPGNYASTVTFNGQQPNGNLLGYRPLGYRRNEAKNLALDHGITEAVFPCYPGNSAFNLDFLMAISNILANTKTFKITTIVFSGLTEIGAQSQIVINHPILQDQEGPAVRGELQPTCLIKESESIFGSGVFFATQLMKAIGGDNQSWSMFVNIPQEWFKNANDRRDLPPAYLSETFGAVSQRASGFRLNVIKTMVTTKR